jgi:hypothetical protein
MNAPRIASCAGGGPRAATTAMTSEPMTAVPRNRKLNKTERRFSSRGMGESYGRMQLKASDCFLRLPPWHLLPNALGCGACLRNEANYAATEAAGQTTDERPFASSSILLIPSGSEIPTDSTPDLPKS